MLRIFTAKTRKTLRTAKKNLIPIAIGILCPKDFYEAFLSVLAPPSEGLLRSGKIETQNPC
jgi:hypothetical protein